MDENTHSDVTSGSYMKAGKGVAAVVFFVMTIAKNTALTINKDGIVYTMTCRYEVNTLIDLYDAIIYA